MKTEFRWKVGDKKKIEHTFTAEDINTFSKLTGDFNPLHIDPNYAESTPAGGLVVHGMLVASFISTLIGMHLPGFGALWNYFQIEWIKIIRVGDTIEFNAEVTKVQSNINIVELIITGVKKHQNETYFKASARVTIMNKKKNKMVVPQSILLTGANGAVGKVICHKLVKQGFNVVGWGRNKDRLNALQTELGEEAFSYDIIDLQDKVSIDDKLKKLKNRVKIDGIVHAAAAPINFVSVDDSANMNELNYHWQIDVLSFLQIVQSLLPTMENGGSIVAILSQAVFDQPPKKLSAYVAAKSACLALIKSFATEWGHKGIRSNAVSPNIMNTPYSAGMPFRSKQVEEAINPLRRLCQPEDVAEIVVFLLSPQSSYINGANIPVTGGSKMPT